MSFTLHHSVQRRWDWLLLLLHATLSQLLACLTFRLILPLHLHLCCLWSSETQSSVPRYLLREPSPCCQGSLPRSSTELCFALLTVSVTAWKMYYLLTQFPASSQSVLSAMNSSVCCSSSVLCPHALHSACPIEGLKKLEWKVWAVGFLLLCIESDFNVFQRPT